MLDESISEDSQQAKKLVKQWIKTTNKYLKRLGEEGIVAPVTSYVARHTFATTAKKNGLFK